MRGDITKASHAKRHPLDWYVEQGWEWDQVLRAIGLPERDEGVSVWDPACGRGTSGQALEGWGLGGRIHLSDVVNNVDWAGFVDLPVFFAADFLELDHAPAAKISIFCNPPYSYRPGIAEAFARRALRLATHRVVMLLPNKWLASQGRFRLFALDHPPEQVLHFCQRPSMPPGDMIAAMGNRAFRGGVIDYCCIVWNVAQPTGRGETRTVWLPPLSGES